MVLESPQAVQLTVALTAGLGCGILIGALLASRRRLPIPTAKPKPIAATEVGGASAVPWLLINGNRVLQLLYYL